MKNFQCVSFSNIECHRSELRFLLKLRTLNNYPSYTRHLFFDNLSNGTRNIKILQNVHITEKVSLQKLFSSCTQSYYTSVDFISKYSLITRLITNIRKWSVTVSLSSTTIASLKITTSSVWNRVIAWDWTRRFAHNYMKRLQKFQNYTRYEIIPTEEKLKISPLGCFTLELFFLISERTGSIKTRWLYAPFDCNKIF